MNRKFAGLFAGFILTGLCHAADTPAPAPSPQVAPQAAAPIEKIAYSSCHVDGPYIAMTFDDGPSPTLTPKLLDILKAHGIKATFFLIGQNAAEYPDIVKRIVAEGHEVGNHSWSHPQLTKLSAEGQHAEIEKTSDAIKNAIGKPPTIMRPPYGATSPFINHWLNKEFGMKIILWSVDPLDWKYHDSARVERVILAEAKPGSIILSHDIHATTVAAMPDLFDKLQAKGYKFVTVSELIAMDKPVPQPKTETASASPTPKQKHKKNGQ
ncbi:MAG: polysaccharide deacetylase family protein [Chthoniobacterales bacterium]